MELLEIEKELAGPGGEEALARYDAVLTRLGARVKAAMDKGLPRAEFEKCAALADATTLARKLIRLQRRDSGRPRTSAPTTSGENPIAVGRGGENPVAVGRDVLGAP